MYKRQIFALALERGTLAQLVEQRTENPCVPGSIPGGTTNSELLVSSEFFIYNIFKKSISCLVKYRHVPLGRSFLVSPAKTTRSKAITS